MMELRAGALRMSYDAGFLRYIRLGEHEVLRMIYHALRDQNWDTMRGSIMDEKITRGKDIFHIQYKWISNEISFPFEWDVEIEGTSDSELHFAIVGRAGKDVLKNRTGFCILHPIEENKGKPCTIFTAADEKVEGRFPILISPHQPFLEISHMEWPIGELGKARLSFEGDVFEMEDQRNWCDNSYKTYCTPQRIPFPAALRAGEEVAQKVSFRIELEAEPQLSNQNDHYTLSASENTVRPPKIGVGAALDLKELSGQELRAIGMLGLNHYRIEIDFSRPDWVGIWTLRTAEAKQMNLGIELILFFTSDFMVEASLILARIEALPDDMTCAILLLQRGNSSTPRELLDRIVPLFRRSSRSMQLGAGTDEFFTELNRQRVEAELVDFVSYSQNPQCHAFDNATMIENLQAHPYAVESARACFSDLPVHVSPVTLKPRKRELGGSTALIPDDADQRQFQLFGAAWTLGSLLSLSKAGADSVTMYECSGYKGLMAGAQVATSGDFQVRPFETFPSYHVIGVFLHHKSANWTALQSSSSLTVEGIRFSTGSQNYLLLANYTNLAIQLELPIFGPVYRVSILEENTVKNISDLHNYFMSNLGPEIVCEQDAIDCELPAHGIAYFDFSNGGKK